MPAFSVADPLPSTWTRDTLEELTWIVCEALGSRTRILSVQKLAGGAINENWRLNLAAPDAPLVLRISDVAAVAESCPCAWEYAVQSAAHAAGVRTPAPIVLCENSDLLGAAFFLMSYATGTARPSDILAGEGKETLAAELGAQLALIHRLDIPECDGPAKDLAWDVVPREVIARYRGYLDRREEAYPVLEWGLRWLEVEAPDVELVLAHGDFRTGNYLVENGKLSAVLDWEFAAPADPHADIGWFCARCWRFTAPHREAGGLASREVLYRAYEQHGDRPVDRVAVAYWEVMAHVRWAIIALQQCDRFIRREVRGLEHALLGRRLAELESEILAMTAGGHA